MNKKSVFSFLRLYCNIIKLQHKNIKRKKAIIKTKEIKILKFLNKEYHISEKLERIKRKKSKRGLIKRMVRI